MRHMCSFLKGRANFVALVDTNQNCKNGRYQFSGYSSVMIMGVRVVDAGLFRVAGIPEEIWRVKYWASDLLVINMASAYTVNKISKLATTEDVVTVSVMCVLL